jgi:predicted DNA-binding transcriptional regulator AlpA
VTEGAKIIEFPGWRARNVPEPLWTKRELAEYLRVSPRWIELRVKHDAFPILKDQHSRLVRFKMSEVQEWLASRRRA